MLRYSSGVITICPDLYELVERLFPGKGSVLIENVVDYGMVFGEEDRSPEIRRTLNLEGKTVALYTGTFEPYQGLDLLIDSAGRVIQRVKKVVFLVVGGHPNQVAFYQEKVRKSGLENYFIFPGQVPPQEVKSYLRCADVLLSPRVAGTNTPLKIYSYLRSGVPIVATRLPTHIQVLDEEVAVLTDPTPEGFAEGVLSVITDGSLARGVGRKGAELAEEKYSYSVYLDKLEEVIRQATDRGV